MVRRKGSLPKGIQNWKPGGKWFPAKKCDEDGVKLLPVYIPVFLTSLAGVAVTAGQNLKSDEVRGRCPQGNHSPRSLGTAFTLLKAGKDCFQPYCDGASLLGTGTGSKPAGRSRYGVVLDISHRLLWQQVAKDERLQV
jgi:hypothetical protein